VPTSKDKIRIKPQNPDPVKQKTQTLKKMNSEPYENGSLTLDSTGPFYYHALNPVTPNGVSNQFFSPQNIRFLHEKLEQILSLLVQQPVRVPLNNEFIQSMYQVMNTNGGLAYLGPGALDELNEDFLEWEASIQYVSIREQKRFQQYILDESRLTTFPYPPFDKNLKGEVVIDTSGYMLTNPWKSQFGNFLEQVLKMGPDKKQNPEHCPWAPETKA
jgi:hypothetical protein